MKKHFERMNAVRYRDEYSLLAVLDRQPRVVRWGAVLLLSILVIGVYEIVSAVI